MTPINASLNQILSKENLQAAYEHVQRRRKQNGPNSDWYTTEIDLEVIHKQLLNGTYHPGPIEEIHLEKSNDPLQEDRILWRRSPADAIVVRAIYQILNKQIISKICHSCSS